MADEYVSCFQDALQSVRCAEVGENDGSDWFLQVVFVSGWGWWSVDL